MLYGGLFFPVHCRADKRCMNCCRLTPWAKFLPSLELSGLALCRRGGRPTSNT